MSSEHPASRTFVSPDGLLRLLVLTVDGDVTVGFDGFRWHTHADILEATYPGGAGGVVERWIADLVGGKLVIAVSRIGGTIQDVWITDDPPKELRHCAADEQSSSCSGMERTSNLEPLRMCWWVEKGELGNLG